MSNVWARRLNSITAIGRCILTVQSRIMSHYFASSTSSSTVSARKLYSDILMSTRFVDYSPCYRPLPTIGRCRPSRRSSSILGLAVSNGPFSLHFRSINMGKPATFSSSVGCLLDKSCDAQRTREFEMNPGSFAQGHGVCHVFQHDASNSFRSQSERGSNIGEAIRCWREIAGQGTLWIGSGLYVD